MSSQDYRRSQANARTLAAVSRRLEEAERGSPLRAGGVGAGGIVVKGGSIRILEGGNIEVDGEATFGGDTTIGGAIVVTGPATIGGGLDVTGRAGFTGNTTIGGALDVTGAARILGTLELPAGIIGNDALASPVLPAVAGASSSIVSFSTTPTVVVAASVTIPAGVTRALVMAIATMSATENAGLTEIMYAQARIRATGKPDTVAQTVSAQLATAKQNQLTSHVSANLSGLTGGTFTIDLLGYGSRAFSPLGGAAAVSATVTFLR